MVAAVVLILIGVVSAIFGSLIGLGGGVIIVPALLWLSPLLLGYEMSAPVAVGTSLTVLILTAASSVATFVKQKRVDFKSGWLFFVTGGPGAVVGALLTSSFNEQSFQLAFGLFMLAMAVLLLLRKRLKPIRKEWKIQKTFTDVSGESHTYGYGLWPALLIGFAVGLISGLFGIGGGSLFVPLMILVFRFPAHVATATSMFVILLSSLTGSLTHAWMGEIDGFSVLFLAPGAIVGGIIGAWIAGKLSDRRLMGVLLTAFFLLSMRMIGEGIF